MRGKTPSNLVRFSMSLDDTFELEGVEKIHRRAPRQNRDYFVHKRDVIQRHRALRDLRKGE